MDVGTVLANFSAGRISHDLTSSSTSSNVFHVMAENDAGTRQMIFVASYIDESDIGRQLMSVRNNGYKIVPKTARISCSIHQDNLDKAKKTLIEKILPGCDR